MIQMTTERANFIIGKLKDYVAGANFAAFLKDNPTVAEQIKAIKAENLRLGECPIVGVATVTGDLTAEGVRYTNAQGKVTNAAFAHLDDGYVQRQTLACEFSTDPMLFASADNRADPTTLAIVAKKLGFKECNYERQAQYMGDEVAKRTATAQLKRLNYKLESCRVNSRYVNYTYGPLPVDVYPVIVDLKDKKGNALPTVIGTYSETNLDDGTPLDEPDINVNVYENIKKQKLGSKTSKSAKRKKIVKWTFISLGIAAAAVIVILGIIGF